MQELGEQRPVPEWIRLMREEGYVITAATTDRLPDLEHELPAWSPEPSLLTRLTDRVRRIWRRPFSHVKENASVP